MDPNQRPHSRQKTVGSGSAGVGRGRQVNTGSGPVGAGGRGSSGGNRGAYSGGGRAAVPVRLGGKSLLSLIVIAVIALFLLRSCGGLSDISDWNDVPINNPTGYQQESFSADSELDLSVSNAAREKYVTPVGNGKDTVTIMVYMCGTDLESKHGMATKDLQEMLNATISDKVNVIVETGGCNRWQNNVISSSVNQIYKIEDEGIRMLEENAGTAAMTDPNNLASFINYCTKNYPADRNMLIFWDHGGGSLTGYGYDEKKPSSSSMTLSKISSALQAADCKFDVIGFDACLMATLENALVCEPYADYLLASEESEPGTGWYYTNWLTELSKNTSIPTVELAQTVIDDFIASCRSSSPNSKLTLSVVDLAELAGTVPSAFRSFSTSTTELLQKDYMQVSNARAGVRQFAQSSKINQVDLVDLAQRIGTSESKALANALLGCVKYNRSSLDRCYGISIYFPYESTRSVGNAVASYQDLGIDSEYAKCIKSFASLEVGGQIATSSAQPQYHGSTGDLLGTLISAYLGGGNSSSPIGALTGVKPSTQIASITQLLSGFSGRSLPGEYSWVDTDLIASQAGNLAEGYLRPERLVPSVQYGRSVLSLREDEWARIQSIELNVFVRDGDGYIDLGLDNTFEWYNDDLLLEYDGTWLSLNGNICAYYMLSDTQNPDGTWTTVGRIPALLNGEAVNLQVVFDEKNPYGTVTGAYPMYPDGETEAQAKGCIAVKGGDKLELLCDYYGLDGSYSASYTLGTAFAVPAGGLVLENLRIDADEMSVMFRLTDIYGSHYWVPVR